MFLLLWISSFSEIGYKFWHRSELCITTPHFIKYVTSEVYIRPPFQRVELSVNRITDKKPYLVNALNRCVTHLSIRDNSHIPFPSLQT